MDGFALARRFFLAGISAGVLVSINVGAWWQSGWEDTAPQVPDPAHHLIVPVSQHGATLYVTPFDSTVQALIFPADVVLLLITFLLLPRGYRLRKGGDTDPGGRWEAGAVLGFAIGVALLWLFGGAFVTWLNAQGVVLHG